MSSYGDLIIRGHDWSGSGWREIEILQADPRVFISGALLDEIRCSGKYDGHAWLNGDGSHASLNGDVLTIRASNRTVVYRIVGRHPDSLNYPDIWVAEWPD